MATKRSTNAATTPAEIRVQAIRDTMSAAMVECGFSGGDAFCEPGNLRAMARRLDVPFLVLELAYQSHNDEDYTSVGESDIAEWLAWHVEQGVPLDPDVRRAIEKAGRGA